MRIGIIADPGSPHTRVWVEGLAARGFEVHVFSARKQAPPVDLPARVTAPLAVVGRSGRPASAPDAPADAASDAASGAAASSKTPPRASPTSPDPWNLRSITRAIRLARPFRAWFETVRPERLLALRLQPEGYVAAAGGARNHVIASWGQDVLRYALRHPAHRLASRRAIAEASLLLGETDEVVSGWARLGARPEIVHKRWTGIDLGFWRPPVAGEADAAWVEMIARHPEWRILDRSHGVPGRSCFILSPRSVAPNGHQRALIRALAGDATAEGGKGSVVLVQAGSGDPFERAACRTLAAERGLSARYADIGGVGREELRALLWNASAVVSLWAPDGLSQTLLQSMASGALVIAADVPGNREWIDSGVNGILVDAADPEAIGRALSIALADVTLRPRAAVAAREVVTARADREVNLDGLADLLLAAGRAGLSSWPARWRRSISRSPS